MKQERSKPFIIVTALRHDRDEDWNNLRGLARATEGAKRCQLHILFLDGPSASEAQTTARIHDTLGAWDNTLKEHHPIELRAWSRVKHTSEQTNRLTAYLADKLIPELIHDKPHTQVGLLWHPTWAEWAAASAAVSVAHQPQVCLFTTPQTGPWQPLRSTDEQIKQLFKAPRLSSDDGLDRLIIGKSKEIALIRDRLKRYADLPVPVLIIGETGTGKELCAHALHHLSKRRDKSFVAVNGALLEPSRAESDLFGHIQGAFTGADKAREGRIKEAIGGTFFLDELSRTPKHVQAQLLRALNRADEEIILRCPMGSSGEAEPLNVRFVSALQRDPRLAHEMTEDLFYRVSTLIIRIPPLRERVEDIEPLSIHFLQDIGSKLGSLDGLASSLHKTALSHLETYDWPGNARELRQVIMRAWMEANARNADNIGKKDIERSLLRQPERSIFGDGENLRQDVAQYVLAASAFAKARSPQNKNAAARLLGFNTGQQLERYVSSIKRRAESAQEDE